LVALEQLCIALGQGTYFSQDSFLMKSNQIYARFNLELETPFWTKLKSKLFRSFGRTPFRCFFKNFWELFSLRRLPYRRNFFLTVLFLQFIHNVIADFPNFYHLSFFSFWFYFDWERILLSCSSRTFLSNSQKRQLTIKVCPRSSFPLN